jgi:hypothetical protein
MHACSKIVSRGKSALYRAVMQTLLILVAAAVCLGADSVVGNWEGVLNVQSQQLKLVLHVSAGASDGFVATLDSPDQAKALGAIAMNMKVDTFTVSGSNVAFELKAIQAKYTGTLNGAHNSISGTWSQLGTDYPLQFSKIGAGKGSNSSSEKPAH